VVRKRKRSRKSVRIRNPLVPALRRLRPKVKPSARAYSRKTKHRERPEPGRDGE
jgi:hypothetical protein